MKNKGRAYQIKWRRGGSCGNDVKKNLLMIHNVSCFLYIVDQPTILSFLILFEIFINLYFLIIFVIVILLIRIFIPLLTIVV